MGVNIEIMGGGAGGPASGDIPPPLVLNEHVDVSIVANQNNWNPGGAYPNVHEIRLTTDATRTITGLDATGVTDGTTILLTNVGANRYTLVSQSASSTAANQFLLPGGSSITVQNDGAILLRYDGTISRWRPEARSFTINPSAPNSVAVDGTNTAGDTAIADARNHIHALPTFSGTPGANAGAGAPGTSGTAPARGDHTHPAVTGAVGPPGPPGLDGEAEYIEPIAVPGPKGDQGDIGPQGPSGGGTGSFVSQAKWEHI